MSGVGEVFSSGQDPAAGAPDKPGRPDRPDRPPLAATTETSGRGALTGLRTASPILPRTLITGLPSLRAGTAHGSGKRSRRGDICPGAFRMPVDSGFFCMTATLLFAVVFNESRHISGLHGGGFRRRGRTALCGLRLFCNGSIACGSEKLRFSRPFNFFRFFLLFLPLRLF